jgi:lipopolysaccharide exporter
LKFKLPVSFWFRSVFFTLLNRFSLIIFGVVGYILLAKKVFSTPAEMGVWSLFLVILSIVETIKQGLLRNPMIKFLSEPQYVSNKNVVQSSTLFVNVLFSTLTILLIVFFGKAFCTWLHSPNLYDMCLWGILMIVLLVPFNHCEVLLQANFQFHKIFIGYFLRQAVFILGIIVFLVFFKSRLSLVVLVQLQIAALLVGSVSLFVSASPFFQKGFIIDKKTMVDMFHFGKYIFGTNVFSTLSRSADQFMTANLPHADALNYVAYYNVVGRINNMMDVPSLAVADVLFPKNVEAIATNDRDKVRYYYEKMVGNILSIIIPTSIAILLVPHLLIRFFAGGSYFSAIPILYVVIPFSFTRPFFYQFGATMDAIGKPHVNFWVNLMYMALSFTFIYLGLHYISLLGAAYGSVAASLIAFIVVYILLKKEIGIRASETLGYILEAYKSIFRVGKKMLGMA